MRVKAVWRVLSLETQNQSSTLIMRKKLTLLLFTSFQLLLANAQKSDKVTISGYVTDANSSEKLSSATIIANNAINTSSNAYGFYSLTLPPGDLHLQLSFTGYQGYSMTFDLQKDTVINLQLMPQAGTLSSVTVIGRKKASLHNSTQMGAIDLPVSFIESMPKLLGETDVMRALQFLPGVQASNEASTGLFVRGGSPDQNLILLDGVPVYNASHLFGIFSVFNTNALQNVQLYKGGFPARYGGRLSSVVDLRMKEGNKNSIHGEGSIGILSSRLMLEGPIQKGKSSFMVSGRTTNWRPLMERITKAETDGDGKAFYGFYDLNAKVNFKLGPKDHLYVSGYVGNDQFKDIYGLKSDYKSEAGLRWGNTTGVLRWNHEFSNKVFANATTNYTRYQYKFFVDDQGVYKPDNIYYRDYLSYGSQLQDVAFKYDLDIIPNPNHYIRVGASVTQHIFDPGTFTSKMTEGNEKKDTVVRNANERPREYDIYMEDDVKITNRLKANIGIHASAFETGSKWYTSVQPRISARYLLSERLSMKASFVTMNQYLHLLANSGLGLPTDLWVPVNGNIPDQRSKQFALGLAYTSAKNIEFSLEGYYKDMKNVLEYREGATFTNLSSNWFERVEIGNGDSYGVELLVQKKTGSITGFVSSTYSFANRTFASINNGKSFPYRYDQRFDFKGAASFKLGEKKKNDGGKEVKKTTELGFDWVFGTGRPITLPLQTYLDQNGREVTIYSERNSFRMPVYHRFDASFSFHKQKAKWQRSWIIGIYNVYNRKNVFYIYQVNNKYKQVSLLPMIPSVSYQIKF